MKLFERVKQVATHVAGSQAALGESLGISGRTFQGYLTESRQDNLWPLLPLILAHFTQIRREWLYFGEGEMIKNPQQLSAADLAAAMPTPDIDKDVLRDVVRTLEEFLEESRKKLSPDAKAEVICQLYQLVLETEDKSSTSKPARMFRIISKAMAG